jgi:hypothetical protein
MALAVVQTKAQTGNNATPTVTALTACTAGNLIIGFLQAAQLIAAITYTGWNIAVNDNDSGGTISTSIIWRIAAGGETSFSLSMTSGQWNMAVMEVSGQAASPLDAAPAVTATGDPTGTGTTCPTDSTGTLAQADEIVVAACGIQANITSPTETGIGLNLIGTATLVRLICGYLIVSSTAAQAGSFSWTTAGNRHAMVATFKADLTPAGQPTARRFDFIPPQRAAVGGRMFCLDRARQLWTPEPARVTAHHSIKEALANGCR